MMHHDEQCHLGEYPKRPKLADQGLAVALIFHEYRVEGVIRPVTGLHQEYREKKRDDRRPSQHRRERWLVVRVGAGIGISDEQAAQPDHGKEHQDRGQNRFRPLPIDHKAEQDDGHHETDRTPNANTRIARYALSQVAEGHDLELG